MTLWKTSEILLLAVPFVLAMCQMELQMPLKPGFGTPGLEYKRLSERLCAAFHAANSRPGPGSSTAGTGGQEGVVLETWLPVQNKPCFKIPLMHAHR